MPQSDMKSESIGNKTIQGIFVAYHVHAGGFWSGDYPVADYAQFTNYCEVTDPRVKSIALRKC